MATRTRRRRSRYNIRPYWMTAKRVIGISLSALILALSLFGVRTVVGLAKAFNTTPIDALQQLIQGKGGSAIQHDSVQSLKRINIALYGYGGPPHDGPYLSDSIMVISIQPQASGPPRVAEISVPRDWYVPIDLGGGKHDHGRINQAYADGMDGDGPVAAGQSNAGASVANPTLSHLLGLDITYFAGVDFSAFQDAVDAVGGVDVDVQNTFTDYQYPAGECVNGRGCGYMTVHFEAGRQHMDGRTALQYARSRHGGGSEGSDFARSKRQQLITAAIKQKVLSIGGIGKLPDLLSALGDHVKTNLTISDAEAIYDLVKGVDPASVVHVSLDDQNFLYECGYPRDCGAAFIYAHDSSYASISHFTNSVFVDPSLTANPVHITIEDGSGTGNGASSRWTSVMGQLGWKLDDQGTTDRTATTQVIDTSGGSGAPVARWFAAYFGVGVTTPTPSPGATPGATPAAAGDSGITIILGRDEEKAFNNDPGYGD
jgi:LCP family protein required for cell wall assembly